MIVSSNLDPHFPMKVGAEKELLMPVKPYRQVASCQDAGDVAGAPSMALAVGGAVGFGSDAAASATCRSSIRRSRART